MDINLDESEKLLSLVLGVFTVLSLLFRKFLIPRWNSFVKLLSRWFFVPREIARLQERVKNIENSLIISEVKVDLLLNDQNGAFFECDTSGNFIWVNNAVCLIFGIEGQALLGDGWINYLNPEDTNLAYSKWHSAMKEWIPYRARYRVINSETNEEYQCESTAFPVLNKEKEIIGYIGKIVKL